MPRWLSLALLGAFSVALAFGYARFIAPLELPLVWEYAGTRYQLLEPRALGWVLLAPFVLLVLYKSLADLPWQQRLFSALCRIAFITLLALSVSRLVRSVETRRIATVFLVDVSDSVSDAALASATAWIEDAWKKKGAEDDVRVIRFARRPHYERRADVRRARASVPVRRRRGRVSRHGRRRGCRARVPGAGTDAHQPE